LINRLSAGFPHKVGDRTDGLVLVRYKHYDCETDIMPIRPLLSGSGACTPEQITVITTAFEDTLNALGLFERQDPVVHMVAERMFELAKLGERDRYCCGTRC
jgi:hypothetical protein